MCGSMASSRVSLDRPPVDPLPAGGDALDALLLAITACKGRQRELEEQLEDLLLHLSEALEQGSVDPSFQHAGWSFVHSPGRLKATYPESVNRLEAELKAARQRALQQGLVSQERGKPFWTVRPAQV